MTSSSSSSPLKITRLLLAVALSAAASLIAVAGASAQTTNPPGAYTTTGAWNFLSEPNLHPPKLHTHSPVGTQRLAPGYFLTANFPNVVLGKPLTGQGGPLILDNKLEPVWFDPAPTSVVTTDLKQQVYNGQPALSWWAGVVTSTGATASGSVYVVNQHYRQVAKLSGADGWVISPHEVDISGTDAWVTSYKVLPGIDLSAYGGVANGTLYDFAVQKYDLKTGQLLYSWDAYNPGGTPRVPLADSETHAPPSAAIPWDAYHGNSIQLIGSNQFLVSMRDTWAGYLVNAGTGQVVWKLGGKPTAQSISLPPSAQFQWQHEIELLPGNVVTLFDDHCCALVGAGMFAPPTGPSRGLVLKIDPAHHTGSLVAQYPHSPTLNTAFTGSMQLLKNGNALVGWGSKPYFTEYTSSGKALLDAIWPGVDLSYRVLQTDTWVGTPYFPPRGAVKKGQGGTTVYASWDGATKVAGWLILGGRDARHLALVASRPRTGFETTVRLGHSYKAYRVKALDVHGRVLGTSAVFPKKKGSTLAQGY